jgi:hypothetical protein
MSSRITSFAAIPALLTDEAIHAEFAAGVDPLGHRGRVTRDWHFVIFT